MSYYERAERLREKLKEALGDSHELIAQLESEDEIKRVHQAWKEFALDNGCEEKDFEVGWSYLQVCGDRVPAGVAGPAASAQTELPGLEQIGEEQLDIVYPRELEGEQRWFRLRVVAGSDGRRRSIVVQTNVNPTAPDIAGIGST